MPWKSQLLVVFVLLLQAHSEYPKKIRFLSWPSFEPDPDYMDELLPQSTKQVMYVDRSNPHCNFIQNYKSVCYMTDVDAVLVVQDVSQFSPFSLELLIVNASNVVLHPVCVPWIRVVNVKDFNTRPYSKNFRNLVKATCKTWLRALDSHLGIIDTGIHDLSLSNSSVDVIHLENMRDFMSISSNISRIQQLQWFGYAGFIVNTSIGSIESMSTKENITMTKVRIKNISFEGLRLSGANTTIASSQIDYVDMNGITVTDGKLIVNNSTFNVLSRGAVNMFAGTELLLQNVIIINCSLPCIVLAEDAILTADNVTVNSFTIENVTGAVHYLQDDPDDPRNFSLISSKHCSRVDVVSAESNENSTQIQCDFNLYHQAVFITKKDEYDHIIIYNAENFHAQALCNTTFEIYNSTGLYTSHLGDSQAAPDTCGSRGSVQAFNASLIRALHSRTAIEKLTVNGNSAVKSVRCTTNIFDISGGNAELLETNITQEANWTNSKIFISKATVSQLFVDNVEFSEIHLLKIGQKNSNSIINNTVISSCSAHCIHVSSGLVVENVIITDFDPIPFYVEDNAKLSILNVTFIGRNQEPVISSNYMDQIEILDTRYSYNLSELVHIRANDGVANTGNFSVAGPGEPYCIAGVGVIVCDYQNSVGGNNVLVRKVPRRLYIKIRVLNAKEVTLDICMMKIELQNISSVSMRESGGLCEYDLISLNANISKIINHPNSLRLVETKIDSLQSVRTVKRAELHSCAVTNVTLTLSMLEMSHVTINSIHNITLVKSQLTFINPLFMASSMTNVTVQDVHFLKVESYLLLTNIVFKYVKKHAIEITGKLSIHNAVMQQLDDEAILIRNGSTLEMVNVTIKQGSVNSFVLANSLIKLENVTINGKNVVHRNTLHFVPEDANHSENPASTAAREHTTKPVTQPIPFISTATVKHSSAKRILVTSYERNNETEPEWVRAAAVGATIFMILLVVLLMLSAVFAYRASRQGQSLIPSFFRIRFTTRQCGGEEFVDISRRTNSSADYVMLPS